MKINISDLKAYYISLNNPPEDDEIFNVLIDCGFTDINPRSGVIDKRGKPFGLSKAMFNIFKEHLDKESFEPFIIFEEDARPINDKVAIKVPDNADMVYLGIIGKSHFSSPILKSVPGYDAVYRASNILGTHAIIYFTEKCAKMAFMSSAQAFAGIGGTPHIDGQINSNAGRFNVYAIDPLFYQHESPFTEYTKIESLKQYVVL